MHPYVFSLGMAAIYACVIFFASVQAWRNYKLWRRNQEGK